MMPVYARQPFPNEVASSIFLAGPTPRDKSIPSWRPEALRLLKEAGYTGHVFVPEEEHNGFRDWEKNFPYVEQVEWEEEALNRADCILFWIPRDMSKMPALTTNDEYGFWKASGKVILGTPEDAAHVRYQRYYAVKMNAPCYNTLADTVHAAVKKLGAGRIRQGGEAQVPLMIWETPAFQEWYLWQKRAGNRLDGARVVWNFRVGPERDIVFAWALHVNVFVASEQRNKTNEVILARPDTSAVLLFHVPPRATSLRDIEVVTVMEFRSTARNTLGKVIELPGGSTFKPGVYMEAVASTELQEETGFSLDPSRLRFMGHRQLAPTFSTHHTHLYAARVTTAEMEWIRENCGKPRDGGGASAELTYTQILRVEDMLKMPSVDWSTLGMTLSTLLLES